MKTKLFHLCTLLSLSFFIFSQSTAAETHKIFIDVKGESTFDVLYHRALSNATGAAIGGLIGAGIQAGIESGKDEKKRNELAALVKKNSWKEYFLNKLNSKLESYSYAAVWMEDSPKKPSKESLVLTLYPDIHGAKVVNSNTQNMSAFIAFTASLTKGKEKIYNKEPFYLTSKKQRPYSEYAAAETSPLNEDLTYALSKAAKRLANKIIYKLKD